MNAEQLATDTVSKIVALAEHRGGVVVLLNAGNSLGMISSQTQPLLAATMAMLMGLGSAYHPLHLPLDDVNEYAPKLVELLERNDVRHVVTFFQPLRTGEDRAFEWYRCMARLIAQDNADWPQVIVCFASPIAPETLEKAKEQRHSDEQLFLQQHAAIYATLSHRERTVVPYMALGFTAYDVAAALQINHHAAQTFRYAIRAKLRLRTSRFELAQYVQALNLT
jgi:DNA-binding CsgD family transcriptional regulator